MANAANTRQSRDDAPDSKTAPVPSGARSMSRILVCLDRSSLSEACLPQAISIARVFGSSVTLLYVMQPLHEQATRITDPLGWEVARREASAYLERLAKEAGEAWGLSVDSRIEQGRPAERIIATAREIGAELTVIASHGESGLAAWNLGSTAQQILSVSRGSVLVARAAPPVPSVVAPQHVLVPLDGSLRTESVLPTTARIAEAYGAEVLLAHVVVEPVPTAVLHAEDLDLARELASRVEARAKRYLDHVRDRMPRNLRVRTSVMRHADELQALLEISGHERVDLVVLSAHGSVCNPTRPFGSVTYHLVSHSTVPLLILQDLQEPELERRGEEGDPLSAPPLRSSYPPEVG